MQTYKLNSLRLCKKHNTVLKHGVKPGYNPKTIYKEGYYKTTHGYFSHCEKCLNEIEENTYGKTLF